jgi:hypothetical protein
VSNLSRWRVTTSHAENTNPFVFNLFSLGQGSTAKMI